MSEPDIDAPAPPTTRRDNGHTRELRLALVCYGGVSLAVYMHGITWEILKLVRASRAYHALPPEERAAATWQSAGCADDGADTEAIYFDLLRDIGDNVSLRVVVDVIAGASAGGIAGIMLARALAFDLSLAPHRDFWLELADVTELLDPAARAGQWSKPYMRPFLRAIGLMQRYRARQLGAVHEEPEVMEKLSLFTRSRWFEPPFSGARMSEMMLDALLHMGTEHDPHRSLIPPGIPLELFVTTTDFWGYRQTITLHDPPEIDEHEHRHVLHFQHVERRSGAMTSQLSGRHIPSLAFAARATSSFPGAFPPARLEELDDVLRQRGLDWSGREDFVNEQFGALRLAGEDPETAAFIDGSVLMNKPISIALQSVQSHVAHRETDRRLVYLEPNPDVERQFDREVPGFFTTLKGALSDIPRNQPIRDDLEWIEQFNEHVRMQRQVIGAVKPNVLRMIGQALAQLLVAPPRDGELGNWRHAANERAAEDAGYAYEGYVRLKIIGRLRDLAAIIQVAAGLPAATAASRLVDAWVRRVGIRPVGDASAQAQRGENVPWIAFLRRFDVRHRLRRVLLLIRRANELYADADATGSTAARQWLDDVKLALYEHADRLRALLEWRGVDVQVDGTDDASIDAALQNIAAQLDLPRLDASLDELLTQRSRDCPEPTLAREMLIAYLGFAYYDVLMYPMSQARDLDALEEIKVDRISVDDANSLRQGGARQLLKGTEFGNFGAFFSRRFRENDYLWGRLTGAERLVDIVASAAPEATAAGLDLVAYKKRLFVTILETEAPHLGEVADLIAELRADAERL